MSHHTPSLLDRIAAFFTGETLPSVDKKIERYVPPLNKPELVLRNLEKLGLSKDVLIYARDQLKLYLRIRKSILVGCSFADEQYKNFTIPKRNGEMRVICSPGGKLKKLHKQLMPVINKALEERYVDYGINDVNGFRKGKSNITNAIPHVGKPMVVSVDVKDFFPSISKQLLRFNLQRILKEHGLGDPYISAYFLAELLSYRGGLPAGSPISPMLSNLCMFAVDVELSSVAKKWNLNYSRYADDITISGSGESPKKFIVVIRKELNKIGLQLNYKKTAISRAGRRQKVCGLNVNSKVSLSRAYRRSIRAAEHSLQLGRGLHFQGKPMSEIQLKGHRSYIKAVSLQR